MNAGNEVGPQTIKLWDCISTYNLFLAQWPFGWRRTWEGKDERTPLTHRSISVFFQPACFEPSGGRQEPWVQIYKRLKKELKWHLSHPSQILRHHCTWSRSIVLHSNCQEQKSWMFLFSLNILMHSFSVTKYASYKTSNSLAYQSKD